MRARTLSLLMFLFNYVLCLLGNFSFRFVFIRSGSFSGCCDEEQYAVHNALSLLLACSLTATVRSPGKRAPLSHTSTRTLCATVTVCCFLFAVDFVRSTSFLVVIHRFSSFPLLLRSIPSRFNGNISFHFVLFPYPSFLFVFLSHSHPC